MMPGLIYQEIDAMSAITAWIVVRRSTGTNAAGTMSENPQLRIPSWNKPQFLSVTIRPNGATVRQEEKARYRVVPVPTFFSPWPTDEGQFEPLSRSSAFARVAQMVERRTRNAEVAGSIPALGSNSTPKFGKGNCHAN